MAWRSIVGRASRMRWCRAVAGLSACAVAVQCARIPLHAAAEAAACCCPPRTADEACGCPVCAHRRQIEAGHAVLETCGARAQAPAVASLDSAVPPPPAALALRSGPAAAVPFVPSPPPEPAADVPTPPPLRRG